jgi:hypothetical protein
LIALAAPLRADLSWSFSGSLVAGPTYQRPEEDLTASANEAYYHVQVFRVPDSGPCAVYSAQDFDGFVSLYAGGFDPAAPLANLVAADDDGELGGLTSKLEPVHLEPGVAYHLVTSSYFPRATGTFETTIQCDADLETGHIGQGSCTQKVDGTETCLLGGRFRLAVAWQRRNGAAGKAKVAPFSSEQAALFYLTHPSNWEMLVKVIDGCRRNGHFWVSTASVATVPHTISVTDTETGAVRRYEGTAAGKGNRTDTKAFPCG